MMLSVLLQRMLADYASGEKAMLLVGNQVRIDRNTQGRPHHITIASQVLIALSYQWRGSKDV